MMILDKIEKLKDTENISLNEDEFDNYIMDMIGVSEDERIKFNGDKNGDS